VDSRDAAKWNVGRLLGRHFVYHEPAGGLLLQNGGQEHLLLTEAKTNIASQYVE
jgi:hypothetical protein